MNKRIGVDEIDEVIDRSSEEICEGEWNNGLFRNSLGDGDRSEEVISCGWGRTTVSWTNK